MVIILPLRGHSGDLGVGKKSWRWSRKMQDRLEPTNTVSYFCQECTRQRAMGVLGLLGGLTEDYNLGNSLSESLGNCFKELREDQYISAFGEEVHAAKHTSCSRRLLLVTRNRYLS